MYQLISARYMAVTLGTLRAGARMVDDIPVEAARGKIAQRS